MYTTLPLFCRVWYLAGLSSASSDTLEDFVLQGLVPRKILFFGVPDPASKLRPGRIRWYIFESLPVPLTEYFFKIACMYKLQHKAYNPCLKSQLAKEIFFVLLGIRTHGTTFKFNYLREFETEFENILGYESGAYIWGRFMKKHEAENLMLLYL
jgi:hypothetical protein